MKPKTIVISLPVASVDKSLEFYKTVLGMEISSVEDKIITIELPNLSLFLIERNEFEAYSSVANIKALQSSNQSELIISCAFQTKKEIIAVQSRLEESGVEFVEAKTNDDTNFIGYFKDVDGHLWELVWNETTARN